MDHDKRVIVTLSNDRPFAEVEKDLTEAGLTIEEALQEIGVVTGRSTAAKAKLRSIRGVSDVADEHAVSVGPPGGKDTW